MIKFTIANIASSQIIYNLRMLDKHVMAMCYRDTILLFPDSSDERYAVDYILESLTWSFVNRYKKVVVFNNLTLTRVLATFTIRNKEDNAIVIHPFPDEHSESLLHLMCNNYPHEEYQWNR